MECGKAVYREKKTRYDILSNISNGEMPSGAETKANADFASQEKASSLIT
jgi:hypothetical protein